MRKIDIPVDRQVWMDARWRERSSGTLSDEREREGLIEGKELVPDRLLQVKEVVVQVLLLRV